MSRTFTQLSLEQRKQIKELLDENISKRAIANLIGVHHSTIYREIEKGTIDGVYNPEYAESQYQMKLSQKGQTAILYSNPDLACYISELILKEHLSPDKIAKRIKEDSRYRSISISRETIYNSIENGLIPNVTKESLHTTSTIFNGGQIVIPKWVMEKLNLQDGDVLQLEISENNEIIYSK